MRKYFLLSIVALLATSNVNATTDYFSGTVTASATVTRTTEISCTPLNFGTVYIQSGEYGWVKLNKMDYTETSESVTKVIGESHSAKCTVGEYKDDAMISNVDFGTTYGEIMLTTSNGDTGVSVMSLEYIDSGNELYIYGTLDISQDAVGGTYEGSMTVLITY